MITATEARMIQETSQNRIEILLAQIDPIIRKAADAGENLALLYVPDLWESHAEWETVQPTSIQTAVCDALQFHGFKAGVVKACELDHDNEPDVHGEYVNHVIMVGW